MHGILEGEGDTRGEVDNDDICEGPGEGVIEEAPIFLELIYGLSNSKAL